MSFRTGLQSIKNKMFSANGAVRAGFWRQTFAKIAMYIILTVLAFFVVFPCIWMILASLKPYDEFLEFYAKIFPNDWSLTSYKQLFSDANLNFGRGYLNSMIVVIGVIPCGTFFASMAAFSFAKLKLRHKTFWLLFLLSGMMVPGAVLLLPRYIAYQQLSWIDTLLPLIVPHLFIHVSMMFFFIQYMRGISNTIFEAAKIDGSGYLFMHVYIMIPLMIPAISAQVIFWFMGIWNDYFAPSIYLTSASKLTLQAMLARLNSNELGVNFTKIFAGAVMSSIPMIVFYIVFQNFFIESITIGAVKE